MCRYMHIGALQPRIRHKQRAHTHDNLHLPELFLVAFRSLPLQKPPNVSTIKNKSCTNHCKGDFTERHLRMRLFGISEFSCSEKYMCLCILYDETVQKRLFRISTAPLSHRAAAAL